MGANTSYNRFVRAQSIVRDVYASARSFHWTHDRLLEEMGRRFYDTDFCKGPKHKRLTGYQAGYIAGMLQVLRDNLYARDLVWAFDVGRPLPVSGWDNLTEPEKELIRTSEAMEQRGHHFWRDSRTGEATADRFS